MYPNQVYLIHRVIHGTDRNKHPRQSQHPPAPSRSGPFGHRQCVSPRLRGTLPHPPQVIRPEIMPAVNAELIK